MYSPPKYRCAIRTILNTLNIGLIGGVTNDVPYSSVVTEISYNQYVFTLFGSVTFDFSSNSLKPKKHTQLELIM